MGLIVTDVGLEKKASGLELKKHAATIHCSNTLSLLQRKISNALLYHAYKYLLVEEEHEINIKQLCRLIGYNGNNHAAIKEALKGLLSTVIEWNVVNDTTGLEDWTASSILASVSLRGPVCLYAYSPRMKKLLHSPSMFGKINLFVQSHFKSSYGLALYENCIRYRGLPATKWFDLQTFRKLMGVPDDIYPIFRDFKRRVLDKSVEEVNTYSDLIVDSDLGKEGRKVVKIRFHLKERKKKTRLGTAQESLPDINEDEAALQTKLITQFGLTSLQVQQIMAEYSLAFITDKISVVEESKNFQFGKVQNLPGYLLSALRNNYQPGKASVNQLNEKRLLQSRQQEYEKQVRKHVSQLREEYARYRDALIDREFELLSSTEKTALIEQFYQYAGRSITTILKLQANKYTRETILHSPQIKVQFRHFILQELDVLQKQLISFEKFVEGLREADRLAWNEFQTFKFKNERV